MKNSKKICSSLLLLLMTACVVSGCGISRGSKNKLKFAMFGGNNWDVAVQDSYEVMENVIERFERAHPDVEVVYETGVLKDDYSEWLSEKILSDDAPDVMAVSKTDFDRFVDLDILQNLDDYVNDDTEFNKSAIYSAALETGKINGSQYALPIETIPYLMFVNKSLLSKENIAIPGNDYTFEDLYDICSKVTKDTDEDGLLDQFGIYKYSWRDAAAANNAVLFSEDGKSCNFTSTELKDAIKFMNSLELLNEGQTVTQEMFDEGKVAFMPLTLAEYRTYKTYPYKIKKYSDFQWDCIAMPKGPDGDNKSRIDTLNIGMSSMSVNKDIAWEFMKFLTTDENVQLELYKETPAASVLPSVMESDEAEKVIEDGEEDADQLVHSSMISDTIKNGSAELRFEAYEGAMNMADSEIMSLIASGLDIDIDSSMRDIQTKVTDYINRF
ncbi:MAG: sugar ABC transporter substrate-binding protein [Lachnospiraceae bacterium]|nr:sugar ABC transporter substrate-binding protein [Lachnospiraceae bacterium]